MLRNLVVAVGTFFGFITAPSSADDFDQHRKQVEQLLPGGYVHTVHRNQGGCAISPVKGQPGHFLLEGEGASGRATFKLSDDNAYKLVKVSGESHPKSAVVIVTRDTIELVFECQGNHAWVRPR